ncbi:NotI family restriction endonuclease [Agrobacterium cavarae]|uniref:NotI family restriction endonuclease n=1 Tax=Agrobacterium cavarae TaxID=2528239 RepID=UPI002FFB1FA0
MAERFHIAEWYGRPFLDLTDRERVQLARHKVGSHTMKKADVERLIRLQEKESMGALTPREQDRLDILTDKLDKQNNGEQPCPFRTDMAHPTCTKPGGVCSLRLYTDNHVLFSAVDGERGLIRALCPYRFHQGNTAFEHIGQSLLGDPAPTQAGEVGFLESTGNLDSMPGEDVGRIDMILVADHRSEAVDMKWCAVEVQAVYFSGREMAIEFRDIEERQGRPSMPVEARRPDYRSSGPKRLMPQLQIKVPTLRRWGKKMAILVDVAFFKSMGEMKRVEHLSNCDVVWFLADFVREPGEKIYRLKIVEEFGTTLESAIEGLTGGEAVALEEFEARIQRKIPVVPLNN